MDFKKEYLDAVLVTAGLLFMFLYHLFLLYQYLHNPIKTSIGYENKDKETWVEKILNVPEDANDVAVKDKVSTGLGVIYSNTSATMTLASISLTLCAVIGVWISSSTNKFVPLEMVYGNISESIISIKYLCLLSCLLLAFSFFVQSARHFIHSNYLLSTPGATEEEDVEKVQKAVERGSIFWSLGLRSLYFALNFMLWFFGPIPMCACSIVMVFVLYCHDLRKESKPSDNRKKG
ncbi:PREDICTED: uncharacterized protein LOC101296415 [Fragaria vesca subsp. vesca]|uniref:uncharacterized protein LOC101296415 n=1 Tax=Fragaria vesca subsp. vesca TaxID=101020 RepID=UPI0002C2E4CC|nr:PREDICTED: uncharacterized protein LOC101296415 [Fragaria vesca subsp. vesca]